MKKASDGKEGSALSLDSCKIPPLPLQTPILCTIPYYTIYYTYLQDTTSSSPTNTTHCHTRTSQLYFRNTRSREGEQTIAFQHNLQLCSTHPIPRPQINKGPPLLHRHSLKRPSIEAAQNVSEEMSRFVRSRESQQQFLREITCLLQYEA